MDVAGRNLRLIDEAAALAQDGEIGNSDAIALLQAPHSADDLKEILARFATLMTREAKSKLSLAAFVPRPPSVANQRYEPIFDRYPISGRTYTTASGTVVLNEVQYYNGEMVQVYGDCTNVAAVREALAGSGYKPAILRHGDGRETAIAQFWSHNLTDTSLRPYNAMFIVVAAVREDAPDHETVSLAHGNGASSVLSALRGTFNPSTSTYQNSAVLFFVRLLDSTRVAIEVGRERMGTDKRPGTIDLTHAGRTRRFVVKDGAGRGVARIETTPDDGAAYMPEIAKAAAAAGVELLDRPGAEYVFPSVARICREPVVGWQWRTDITPRLQPVRAGTVAFDASSDEGGILTRWGFQPRVMAYIPNVRGVVTGVPEASPASRSIRTAASSGRVVLLPRRW